MKKRMNIQYAVLGFSRDVEHLSGPFTVNYDSGIKETIIFINDDFFKKK